MDPSDGRDVVCGSRPGSIDVGGGATERLDVVVGIGTVVEVVVEALEVVALEAAR